MPKIKTEVTFDWKEIRNLIAEKHGIKIISERYDMNRTGDYDMGDYREELNTITFQISVNENKILTTSHDGSVPDYGC